MSPKREVPPKNKEGNDSPAKKKLSVWGSKKTKLFEDSAEVTMDAATSSTSTAHEPAVSPNSGKDSQSPVTGRGASGGASADVSARAVHVSQLPDCEKDGAPEWFVKFEQRQQARFEALMRECATCREEHEGMKVEIDHLKDEVRKLSTRLEEADLKIDDLENRSRRNNIVLFGVPEGLEGSDCSKFVVGLLKECNLSETEVSNSIQRAHRSGQRRDVDDS